MADGLLAPDTSVFDYGCGRGGDIERLRRLGYEAAGWDPAFSPNTPKRAAQVVNLGYVVNVIEDAGERADTLRAAWDLTRSLLIVAARLTEQAKIRHAAEHLDGLVTSRRTFQKSFTQEELRAWIDATLGVRRIAAAPGIFYVFLQITGTDWLNDIGVSRQDIRVPAQSNLQLAAVHQSVQYWLRRRIASKRSTREAPTRLEVTRRKPWASASSMTSRISGRSLRPTVRFVALHCTTILM
jgi:DNA phosphorothioation-associated putative methyltransferase